jgi:hypothetical protein
MVMTKIAVRTYRIQRSWRIISSRFPPIEIFEEIASSKDFAALYELEGRTNNRLRNDVGNINLIPPEECVFGAGAGYVMAAFTHLNIQGSRFGDGTYGVYYAAKNLKTAIEETKYHMSIFLAYTDEQKQELDMRVLTAGLNAKLHDITGKITSMRSLYKKDDYFASQIWARNLKQDGAEGIIYDSVRDAGGTCFAIFRPKAISLCKQERHLRYAWDGKQISNIYELKELK